MKCFIHVDKEAVAACKNCGKGMCADCSAYSGHSGICPECRKAEFEKELARLKTEVSEDRTKMTWFCIAAALIIIAAIVISIVAKTVWGMLIVLIDIYFAVKIVSKAKEINETTKRINYLTGEITKLNKALASGSGLI